MVLQFILLKQYAATDYPVKPVAVEATENSRTSVECIVWCGAVQNVVVRCSAVWCAAVHCAALLCHALCCGAVHCAALR